MRFEKSFALVLVPFLGLLAGVAGSANDSYQRHGTSIDQTINEVLNPSLFANSIIQRHQQNRIESGSHETSELKLPIGGGLDYKYYSAGTSLYSFSEGGFFIYDENWERMGIFGQNLADTQLRGRAAQTINASVAFRVNPAQLDQAVQMGLDELATHLPVEVNVRDLIDAPDELGLPEKINIPLNKLLETKLKDPKPSNAKLMPVDVDFNGSARLVTDVTEVDADVRLDRNEMRIIFGIPVGKSFFMAGFKEAVDTAYIVVKAKVHCQIKVDGSLKIQSGGEILTQEVLSENLSCFSTGDTIESGVSQEVRWRYTVAVLGFGHRGDHGEFHVLVETPPIQGGGSPRQSTGTDIVSDFDEYGSNVGFEAGGQGCLPSRRVCAGGFMRLVTVVGKPASARGNLFAIVQATAHTQLGAVATARAGINHVESEGVLQMRYDNGTKPDWLFEVGLLEFRYSNPGFGDADDVEQSVETSTDRSPIHTPMANGQVQTSQRVDYLKNFFHRKTDFKRSLGFIGVGRSKIRFGDSHLQAGGRLYENGGFGVYMGGTLNQDVHSWWRVSYEDIEINQPAMPEGEREGLFLVLNLSSRR